MSFKMEFLMGRILLQRKIIAQTVTQAIAILSERYSANHYCKLVLHGFVQCILYEEVKDPSS